jgi:uncharacterized protein (TIGR02001 family)
MKNTNLLVILTIIISLFNNSLSYAQQDSTAKENPISISVDLNSRYVWRGTDFGASPSIQPGITYEKSGFTIGAWGAYATNLTGAQEADLYVGYTFYKELFSVTITDYYFPDEVNTYHYFDYKKQSTGHILEASLSFNGTEKLPLTVLIATNIYGADAKKINRDGTMGENQFSTYAELGYSFKNFNIFLGTNLTQVDKKRGESGFYGDYLGVVNLGITSTKEIKISKSYNLPLTVSLITNPQAEKIFLVAGFSF